MQVIQNISMDFTVHGITPKIYGKQDDSGSVRAVAISLYSGGAAYPISEDIGFMLRYKTAAGAIGLYDVLPDGSSAFSVDGNTVTVTLVDQIFAMPGNVECELRVIEPETVVYSGNTATQTSGMISTWTWIVEVERSNVGDATIPSDYINVLSGYASAAVQAAAEAKESASSIDTSTFMKLSDYDASGAVKSVGGIASYVRANAAQNRLEDSSLLDFELSDAAGNFAVQPSSSISHAVFGKVHFIKLELNATATKECYADSFYLSITGFRTQLYDSFVALGSLEITIPAEGRGSRNVIIGTPFVSTSAIQFSIRQISAEQEVIPAGASISAEVSILCAEV